MNDRTTKKRDFMAKKIEALPSSLAYYKCCQHRPRTVSGVVPTGLAYDHAPLLVRDPKSSTAFPEATPSTWEWGRREMYRQFLNSEITSVAGPCLPPAMQTKHLQMLSGMYILQVNSVKNIGVKFEERQKGKLARGPRTLLFELTDGRQTVTPWSSNLWQHISATLIRYATA